MKLFNTCALCATLTVPALVQNVQAEESVAVQFVAVTMQGLTAFAQVVGAMDAEKITPAEGAAAIAEINAAMEELQAALPAMTEDEKAELAAIMSDKEVIAGIEEVMAGVIELYGVLEEADYAGCPELKAACAKFAENFDIEL